MVQPDQRRHVRLKHRAKIRLKLSSNDALVVEMRDFSQSGLFLCCEDDVVNVGDIVEVKTLEIEDAPIQKARVVRVEPQTGFAAEFINV